MISFCDINEFSSSNIMLNSLFSYRSLKYNFFLKIGVEISSMIETKSDKQESISPLFPLFDNFTFNEANFSPVKSPRSLILKPSLKSLSQTYLPLTVSYYSCSENKDGCLLNSKENFIKQLSDRILGSCTSKSFTKLNKSSDAKT